MNEQEERLKFLEYDIENVKMNVENCATLNNFDDLEERFKLYAKADVIQDIRDDL